MLNRMVCWVGIVLAVVGLCGGNAYAQTPANRFGLVVIESLGQDGFATINLEASALAAALSLPANATPVDAPWALLERAGAEPVRIPVQSNASSGLSQMTATLALPPDTPLPARVQLHVFDAPSEAALPLGETISVTQDGARISVRNSAFEIVHDPVVHAGLPSRIVFAASGKVLDGFAMNDRIHHGEQGSFFLREDAAATVELLASGPLEAVVRVTAHYQQGGKLPASHPKAEYLFRYRAGSPAFEVTAACTQDAAETWAELHLMEWNLPPGRPLPQWVKGMPNQSGAFTKDDEAMSASGFAALSDGTNVLGVICAQPRLYSGSGGYGSYVHGPWESWSGIHHEVQCRVWVDGAPGSVDRFTAFSVKPSRAYLTTPDILQAVDELAARIQALPAGPEKSLHQWRLTQTQHALSATVGLVAARQALAVQREWLDASAACPAILTALQQEAKQKGQSILSDADTLLTLDSEDRGVSALSLFSLRTGLEYLASTVSPWWSMVAEKGDKDAAEWTSQSPEFPATIDATQDHAVITWRGSGPVEGITATLDLAIIAGQVHAKLNLENTSALSLMKVTFPKVALGPLGGDPADDVYLRPEVSGILGKAPLLNGLSSKTEYPGGWGPMQFAAHYDPAGGLYLAAHDPYGSLKRLHASSEEDLIRFDVEWPVEDASLPGNDFHLPGSAVIAPFTGDWFDAAQIYRAWAADNAQWWPERGTWGRSDTADWVNDICIWALSNGGPAEITGPTKRFAEYMGVPTAVHWYCWHQTPFDDNYPHYFPVKEGFAAGVAELQAAGIKVMPYINGRLWDRDTPDFEAAARPGATKDREGNPYVEQYGSGQDLVPMCPTQAVWQDKVREIVLRLMSPECNVDGVYIDQIAAATPRECFDASHGHPLCGGHWWTTSGYWPMLARLNRDIDTQYPGKFITTECNGEPFTQYFDGYLTWHFNYDGMVPVFAAIYGGKIQLFSRSYGGTDPLAHCMRAGQSLVFGEQLGWISPSIIDEQPDTAAFLRACARMRHQLLPYLSRGHMMRPPALEGAIPEITADWAWGGPRQVTDSAVQRGAWQAEDGSIAFVFANVSNAPVEMTWHLNPARYGLTPDGLTFQTLGETGPLPETFINSTTQLPPRTVIATVVRGKTN